MLVVVDIELDDVDAGLDSQVLQLLGRFFSFVEVTAAEDVDVARMPRAADFDHGAAETLVGTRDEDNLGHNCGRHRFELTHEPNGSAKWVCNRAQRTEEEEETRPAGMLSATTYTLLHVRTAIRR